jgi:hypothetical protein
MDDPSNTTSDENRVEIVYDNGDKFVGEMQDGKPHGYGAYTWTDGAMFGKKILPNICAIMFVSRQLALCASHNLNLVVERFLIGRKFFQETTLVLLWL